MQSDGGLCPVQSFFGSRAILSGPAGGVVGVSLTAFDPSTKEPVIGFDMGGTSTDVSRYAGELDHVMETTTAGITIQAPQLDINTVAAGGGSRLFFRRGLFVVGPESAGANPGPVCYRKGGYLAVTDANLVLGRILPDYFPKIFGPNENEALDYESALKAMTEVTEEANASMKKHDPKGFKKMSVTDVALGFIDVANEAMCRPIRALTQAKGYDTSHHVLACFGGAGGQHACAIAKALGMKSVYIHRYGGILSAYGLALADVVHEAQEPSSRNYESGNLSYFNERIEALSATCRAALEKQGFSADHITVEPYLHMRYERTDCALMCTAAVETSKDNKKIHGDFKSAFLDAYKREFGFVISDRNIIVDDIRVRGIGKSGLREERTIEKAKDADHAPVDTTTTCFFKEGRMDTNVYQLSALKSGHHVKGPAIIIDASSTMIIEPGCLATITDEGDVTVAIGDGSAANRIGTQVDPIQLSIFSHRFMSIAEQMGRILQRTAISTNMKERLDFSCALFGPDGGLIANAPHIPVHLGGMQATVKFQIDHLGFDNMRDGDVILCNHPKAGGSHLPDFTVITPVYYQNSKTPVFFVANRGHHADIGGLVPGSMPPHSTNLNQEGAAFISFKLVEGGSFNEKALIEQLNAPGKVPGCSGSRNLNDNISDLRAQVAANNKGINLVCELIDAYGMDVVQAYMGHIQSNAEIAVREMLKEFGRNARESAGEAKLHAVDYMDDGTPIELTVDINEETGEATFDFTGTGPEVYGSCNAPPAVTMAAVIYCLRCLVGHDIPLNQGCMAPITTHIPPGTILSAHESAAVVGGNVQTSQRLCDVILKTFSACAASQGCMNNITFGDDDMGYYETVAGGSGAGPTWNGRSGIHTHMTNTRITDPEIMEKRYPIIIRQFGLRANSGGGGKFKGGDGCVRDYEFRKNLTLSILTERRVFAPYGLNGGQKGRKGQNLLRIKAHDGRLVNLGAKTSVPVTAGDIFELRTPGGGGWGKAE
uniref:5-oxoprolinase n=1 Tax=Plectus sambesii TaxID=2011161 RepID=A0A914WFH1_9BILA